MMDFYLNSTIAGYLNCPDSCFNVLKRGKKKSGAREMCYTTHGESVYSPCLLSNEPKKRKEKGRAFVFF